MNFTKSQKISNALLLLDQKMADDLRVDTVPSSLFYPLNLMTFVVRRFHEEIDLLNGGTG
jgi:hypothetical protein